MWVPPMPPTVTDSSEKSNAAPPCSVPFWRRGAASPRARKVLFLDVDGVLNTETMRQRDAIHATLLKRLGHVLNYSGAAVVLSSTWRLHPAYRSKLLEALASVGVHGVVDDTPQLPLKLGPWPPAEHQRASEIAQWLSGAPALDTWAAVDDLDLTQSAYAHLFHGHFVRTSKECGLSEACSAALCDVLGPCNFSALVSETDESSHQRAHLRRGSSSSASSWNSGILPSSEQPPPLLLLRPSSDDDDQGGLCDDDDDDADDE